MTPPDNIVEAVAAWMHGTSRAIDRGGQPQRVTKMWEDASEEYRCHLRRVARSMLADPLPELVDAILAGLR